MESPPVFTAWITPDWSWTTFPFPFLRSKWADQMLQSSKSRRVPLLGLLWEFVQWGSELVIWAYSRLCFSSTEHIQIEKPDQEPCGIETQKLVMGKKERKETLVTSLSMVLQSVRQDWSDLAWTHLSKPSQKLSRFLLWGRREVELLTIRPKRNKMKLQFFLGGEEAHWRTEERELERERRKSIQSVQSLSCVRLFVPPWITAR